jgi:signal transduction histidine kinase
VIGDTVKARSAEPASKGARSGRPYERAAGRARDREAGRAADAREARLAELVQAEHERAAELHAVVGAIGDPLVVVAADGTIPLANRAAERFIGGPPARTLEALLARFSTPPASDVAGLVAMSPLQLRTPDADPRWYEMAAYPVEPGDETILILHDVTEARMRESIRDSFIGVLSHELRTPVTTIFAGAKVLARTDGSLDDEARASIFEDIHAEAEHLHRLVEDVVALTRFGEGALDIGTDPVLLQRVVPAVIRSEEGRWPGGRFEVAIGADLPPVAGDMTYVEQVLRNLLANAMKYGGPSPVARIVAEPSGREVAVRVLDRGPGFPAEEADRLFELYYRSPSVARVMSGSGIGLFVCARLIEAMGGRVWAVNRPDGGAEFGFTLRILGDDA